MELAQKRSIADLKNSKGKLYNIVLAALVSDLQKGPYEPLAVEVLAGALLEEIPDVNVYIDIVNNNNVEEFVKRCSDLKPTAIGLSIPQGTIETAKSILDKMHDKTNADILVGHAIPTKSNELQKKYPNIIQIKGWGENQLVNVVLRKLGRQPIQDTGKSYAPIRIGEPNEYIRRIEASRGCNYGRCLFCTRPDNTHAPKWKPIDLEVIRKQFNELRDMGVTSFAFTDEDFVGNANQIPELIKLLKDYNFKFSSAMRVETIIPDDREKREVRADQIRSLANVGLSQVFLGVESFIESQQRRYNKHLHGGKQSCINAIKLLADSGVDIEMGLIVFDPKSTKSELSQTADILLQDDLYKSLDHPFSKMRMQEGSLLAKKYNSGLEKLSYNTLNHAWDFEDFEVENIYDRCINWFDSLHSPYSFARSLVRSLPNDESVRNNLSTEISKIRQQFVLLMKAAIDKDNNQFKNFAEQSKQNVFALLKQIGSIAHNCGLFETQTTLSQLDECINITENASKKNKPISMTDFGGQVDEWQEKQNKLEDYKLPYQKHICGELKDFIANPNSCLEILENEDYFKGKFYLKIIKSNGSNKKIYGNKTELIEFASKTFEPNDRFEIVAYLESQVGATAIKKDDTYLEMGVTDKNNFGLDKVKHSSPDIIIRLDNRNNLVGILQNTSNYSQADIAMFSKLVTQHLSPKEGMRYKTGEDNGIEHYTIPYYYEAMIYKDNNNNWQVMFCDVTKNKHFADVNFENSFENGIDKKKTINIKVQDLLIRRKNMSQVKSIKHTNSRGTNFDITVKSTNNPRPGALEMYECVIRSINTNATYEDTVNALSMDDAAELSRHACERIHESSKKLASNSLNKTVTPRTKD